MKNSFLWVIMLLASLCAQAAPPPASLFNPQPLEGDLILPLPDGLELVFRPVIVPGRDFWGDRERVVQLGDAGGGIFEGVQRTMVSGSFPAADDSGWLIWLAKYELTKGQFAAVMGVEALAELSGDAADRTINKLKGRELKQALTTPLTWVSYAALQRFLDRYNRWLFDPDHPERLAKLPKLHTVPGFVRLATEEEWEFAARGGQPALQAGTFGERLPFAANDLNEYGWHVGNAKNQLRPIGLRKPNGLGIHDLYGNAHELTAGLFRPEVWQGKPGGAPVRGASVSTPAAQVRASYRTEFDSWAWNPDMQRMEERRTFNIGARLAIGANVVTDPTMRDTLEQEYAAYRQALRRETPVGRTLDNLVTQAASQLATVDPLLTALVQRYPDAADQVQAIQGYMDQARARLDEAQRQTARSLLQDAARNGVNFSVYLTKRERLQAALASAQKLLEISSRYQEQVAAVERSLAENRTEADAQLAAYLGKVAQLGDYEAVYIDPAFTALRGQSLSAREQRVLDLLAQHIRFYAETRAYDRTAWADEYAATFATFQE